MYNDDFESAKPSGTLGGMLSSLFGGRSRAGMPSTGGLTGRKVLGGALLAAGAAYLYNRSKGSAATGSTGSRGAAGSFGTTGSLGTGTSGTTGSGGTSGGMGTTGDSGL